MSCQQEHGAQSLGHRPLRRTDTISGDVAASDVYKLRYFSRPFQCYLFSLPLSDVPSAVTARLRYRRTPLIRTRSEEVAKGSAVRKKKNLPDAEEAEDNGAEGRDDD